MSKGIQFKDLSKAEKDLIIERTDKFCKWFTMTFDLPIYLIYGTLLGSIRESYLIDSDNDIDLAYLSKYNTFSEVFKEMLSINMICQNLDLILSFGQGSGLPRFCGHSHIYNEEKTYSFDVWTSWIDEKGRYNFYSMGKRLNKNILRPFKVSKLGDKSFLVPNQSEELLTYLYSDDWKTPMNRKSYYYRKDFWKPLIDIYTKKIINKEMKL